MAPDMTTNYMPGRLQTHAGLVRLGVAADFLDKEVHRDMADWSYFKTFLFGATGHEFSDAEVALLDSLLVYTAYPDARLWNNRIVALSANARAPAALALSGGLASSAAYIFGAQAEIQAMEFLMHAVRQRALGVPLEVLIDEEIRQHGRVAGFGRPLFKVDERMAPIQARMRELGLSPGPHLSLVWEVGASLQARKEHLAPNYASVVAAIVADLGVTPKNQAVVTTLMLSLGMPPCYAEWREAPAGIFMSTPVTQVTYSGRPARDWPSA
jgi:citrate synthase